MKIEHFIKSIIQEDIKAEKFPSKLAFRFPPEPNGYLHLGHVKSILLNASCAKGFNGVFNLRFDDTNPLKEKTDYVSAIKNDVAWLLGENTENIYFTSNYFPIIFDCAIFLIKEGLAYVDDNDMDTIKKERGDFHNKGVNSKYRNRAIEENLALFLDMKKGLFKDGEKVLRAKIDMLHSNLNLRDPVIFRIRHAYHHNTHNDWCVYPMYDFAHPISDAIEKISHSLCSLEFEDHRPLYNWIIDKCYPLLNYRPEETEFARLDVEGVVLSKRKLTKLVDEKKVSGWDDASMPTIAGLRNRGFTPEILYKFIEETGVSKANSRVPMFTLENCARDYLNPLVERRIGVVSPVKLNIINLEHSEVIDFPNHPKNKELGERSMTFENNLVIDRSDISLVEDDNFYRFKLGNTVRLKHAYNVKVIEIKVDENGEPIEVVVEMDKNSRNPKEALEKHKAIVHWLNVKEAKSMDFNFYNNLLDSEDNFNPSSTMTFKGLIEKNTLETTRYELERIGYFYLNHGAHCIARLKN